MENKPTTMKEHKNNPDSKDFDPYNRGKSLWWELHATRKVYNKKLSKMSFIDLFVYRWYKNYVEPRFVKKPINK